MNNRHQLWQNKTAPNSNPVSSALNQSGYHGSPIWYVNNEYIIVEYERHLDADHIQNLFDLYQLLLGMQCSENFIDHVMTKLEFL